MDVQSFFSPDEVKEIERVVRDAEGGTSGEIVPYVVGRSDPYHEAFWRGACLGALALALIAAAVHELGRFWGYGLLWLAVPPLVGAGLGWLAVAAWPWLRRALLNDGQMDQMVRMRAQGAFLEQEVFDTRERTGILIFLSLFEHRVVVLADSGINAKVRQDEWDSIVAGIAAGIRAGRPGAALAEGIRRCGALLAERRVERRADDTDELSDALRLRTE
ncbi:MAG: TPM domain-containing protein [Acidobacteriota bacterium]